MTQIKIIFYAILSFFNIQNGQIAAEKTTVNVNTEQQTVEIIQEHLFSIIRQESDRDVIVKQWNELLDSQKSNSNWVKDLDSYTAKSVAVETVDNTIKSSITLAYSSFEDLRALGIWHNKEKNDLSINEIPRNHLKTKDGNLDGNYWVFKDNQNFSFTLEPFLELPEKYKNSKVSLEELLKK